MACFSRPMLKVQLAATLCCISIAMPWSTASAQGAPPAADAVPQTAQTTAPPEATAAQCVPDCRDGYICHEGQCISACNPPCGAGLTCTGDGQCVAAPSSAPTSSPATVPPLPPAPPSTADTPPPPGAWKPTFDRRERGKYRFRPYLGLSLGIGGAGASSDSSVIDSSLGSTGDYRLGVTPGFEAGFEFRFGRIFGIGPAVRVYGYDYRKTTIWDILVTPTFHIPIGMVEIMIPLNVGGTYASDDYGESASGFAFGVTPGINLWFMPAFGIYIQTGLTLHVLVFDTYSSVDYRGMLNTGATFSF